MYHLNNLDRTQAQFKLLESIEEHYQGMVHYIRNFKL
jgi:hypothetical protein